MPLLRRIGPKLKPIKRVRGAGARTVPKKVKNVSINFQLQPGQKLRI